jgi:tRNA nucleotidyltransferase/poly(A) polymerase
MQIALPHHLGECRPGAYLVGGSVRDLIRGITPMDYDIAVGSDPEGFARRMAERVHGRLVVLGKKRFSVYRVVSAHWVLDVTAYKGRDICQDLLARDFTINTLACDLTTGRIIDVTGGIEDLHNGVIRMVSPAIFQKDPIRLIRAFRMAAMLGFHIDSETMHAISQQADLIATTAAERIWYELIRIMACAEAFRILLEMAGTRVLFHIMPELIQLENLFVNQNDIYDVFNHSLRVVEALERLIRIPDAGLPPGAVDFVGKMEWRVRALLKLSALLHDIAKPVCRSGDKNAPRCAVEHAAKGATMVQIIGRRLRLSNHDRQWVSALVLRHQDPLSLFLSLQGGIEQTPPEMGRFLRQWGELTPYLILLSLADHMAGGSSNPVSNPSIIDFLKNLLADHFKRELLGRSLPVLTGLDLINSFRLEPSPLVGALLQRVMELQLAGEIINRQEAIAWVAANLSDFRVARPRAG